MTDKRKPLPLRVLEGQQPARWVLPEDYEELAHEAAIGRWTVRILIVASFAWFVVNIYRLLGGAL